uniref:Uncharacterized protein n=1 Tax=Glossina morsitans morsitans TaxID=37546 RepID=A0A1B0FGC4_GLOMM
MDGADDGSVWPFAMAVSCWCCNGGGSGINFARSCSSCSGSSNCGRNGILQQQQQQQQHHHYQPPQRERSCSRCQSFHRHHHRQRRRSSALYYGSTISNTSKAIVTITPPPPPPPSSPPPTSLATVTNTITATKPSSSNLSISSPLTLNTQHNNNGSPTQTVSCTNFNEKLSPKTAAASTASKHCAFALTHITIQSPLHQLPTSVRHRSNSSSKNSTVQVSSAIADSQTPEVCEIVNSDNIDEPDKIEISEVIDNDLHHDSSLSSFCSSKSSREVDCRRDSLV